MQTSGLPSAAHPVHHLPIRGRRVIGSHGEELVGTTVYCPTQEKSVAVSACERCAHFHALHFDPATRSTSVACSCEPAPTPEDAGPRDAARSPPDLNTPLSTIMTRMVICVRADTPVDEISHQLLRHSIGGVPVVDARGRAVGVVSRTDILRAQEERAGTEEMRQVTARPTGADPLGLEPGIRVLEPTPITAGEVMSPVVLAVHESSNIGQAAALMAFEGVHRLPVVADQGDVVGILSALDILRWLGQRGGYLIPHPRPHP